MLHLPFAIVLAWLLASCAGHVDLPQPRESASTTFAFVCSDDPFDLLLASYPEDGVLIASYDGATRELTPARSASGARYASADAEFWEHQGEVSLRWEELERICVPRDPAMTPGSAAWIAAVEARLDSSDGAGHGPDAGSMEWMMVVQRRLGLNDDTPAPGSPDWYLAVDAALAGRPNDTQKSAE